MTLQANYSIKNTQKASDQPDSNQWPRDNCYASTVSRSANWAIVGWEHLRWKCHWSHRTKNTETFRYQFFDFKFSSAFLGINRWFFVHFGGLCFRSIHVFRDQEFFSIVTTEISFSKWSLSKWTNRFHFISCYICGYSGNMTHFSYYERVVTWW